MDRHVDPHAMPGEVLVHRVVHDLGDAVVEGALIRTTDVHARLLPDGLQTLQFAKLG
jgi:hypothetical protein